MSEPKPFLVIPLTDAAPVKIHKTDWPVIASASSLIHDGGEHEFQANRRTSRWIKVRARTTFDGTTPVAVRFLVYGSDAHTTNFVGEQDHAFNRGMLIEDSVAPFAGGLHLIGAIRDVARDLGDASGGPDAWRELAHECIADLPPVEL